MQTADDAEVLFLVEHAEVVDDVLHGVLFIEVDFAFREVTVHGACGTMTVADCQDNGHGTIFTVTTGEDAFVVSHHSTALGDNAVPAGLLDAVITILKVAEVRILTDRRDNHVAGNHILAAGNFHRSAPT